MPALQSRPYFGLYIGSNSRVSTSSERFPPQFVNNKTHDCFLSPRRYLLLRLKGYTLDFD